MVWLKLWLNSQSREGQMNKPFIDPLPSEENLTIWRRRSTSREEIPVYWSMPLVMR